MSLKTEMSAVNIEKFISELDSFFSREDIEGAGFCLLKWHRLAAENGDKKGELSILNEAVGYYRQTGEEEKGMKAVEDALALIDELQLKNEKSAGTILLNCATTMKSFGKVNEAMAYYDKAENILTALLPLNDPLIAGLYNNKALAHQDIGEYEEAEMYFLKAISITSKSKADALENAVSLVNLAHLYFDIDETDFRVNTLMEKAGEILKNPEYEGFPKYAFACRKCAPSFGYFGYFIDEKYLNEKADSIYAGN